MQVWTCVWSTPDLCSCRGALVRIRDHVPAIARFQIKEHRFRSTHRAEICQKISLELEDREHLSLIVSSNTHGVSNISAEWQYIR